MNNESIIIRINGNPYTQAELNVLIAGKLSVDSLQEWEKEFYSFLKEWFSLSPTIKAQTSGSTGEPSTIELPRQVMEASARRTIEYFNLKEGNYALLSLPCRFIAGKMMVVRAIVGKMDIVTVDPSLTSELLSDKHFNLGAIVPNQVLKLLESNSGIQKIENIRNLLIGGSSIPVSLEAKVRTLKNLVVSTYGMTETASHIAIRYLTGEKRSDIYHCLPEIEVDLNEMDCLKVHVPGQGILQTKDIAELISPTTFRILGRADDVIISGGIKYWPEMIEKKLEEFITGRFIFSSLPDEKLGEKLVLVMEGKPFAMEELQHKITEFLTPFEHPREIYFLKQFPETENGKIKRNEIKQQIRDLL